MKTSRFLLPVFLLSLLLSLGAQAQRSVDNLPAYYKEPLHFGFFLGINKTNFIVTPVDNLQPITGDSLKTILSKPETGFNLGIVSELRLHDYLTLRFVPDIAFAQRDIDYHFAGVDTFDLTKKVESTFLDFPLSLKLRSKRLGNFAAYMLGGGHFVMDLASQKDVVNNVPGQEVVKIRKNDFGYQAGAGVDFFLPYFKFGFEISMAMGLRDLLIKDNTIYSRSLDRLQSKVLLFSFTFEG